MMHKLRAIRKLGRAGLLGLSASCTTVIPAYAQNEKEAASAPSSVLESGEIVVTARKRAESVQNIPASITAIDAAALDRSSVTKPGDFTDLVSGVFMIATSNQGETNVSIRGVSQPRGSESSFALVMDGVQMPNPNAFNQELEDIDHVEVLKGPQGALYGRNAIGGAIIIDTKKPTEKFEGSVRVGVGNGRLREGSAVVSGGIAANLYGRFSLSHRTQDGYYLNTTLNEKADFYRATAYRGRLIWDASDNLSVDIIAANSTVDGAANLFHTQVDGIRGGFNTDVAVDSFGFNVPSLNHQHTQNYSAKIKHTNPLFTTTFIAAYNDLKETQGGDGAFTPNAFNPAYTGLLGYSAGQEDGFQFQFRNQNDLSFELRLASDTDQRLRWLIGAYFLDINRDTMESNGTDLSNIIIQQPIVPGITTSVLWSHNDNKDYAGFGQLEFDITPELELAAGLRWDKEKRTVTNLVPPAYTAFPGLVRKASFSAFQPKFTLTYRPSRDLTVYGTYGEGFKSGGFNNPGSRALILLADPTSTIQDDFAAEKSKSFEGGVKLRLFERALTLNASVFDTREFNQQLFFFFPSPLVRVVASLDKTRIRGAEFDFRYRPNSNLTFSGSFARLDSKILRSAAIPAAVGKRVPQTPSYTANLTVNYDQPITDNLTAFVNADFRATGKIWFDAENIANTQRKAVQIVNGQVGLKKDGLTATLWAKNLFDVKYNAEAVLVGKLLNLIAIAPPRTYGLTLKYDF